MGPSDRVSCSEQRKKYSNSNVVMNETSQYHVQVSPRPPRPPSTTSRRAPAPPRPRLCQGWGTPGETQAGEDGLWVPPQPSDRGPGGEEAVLLAPQQRLEREGGAVRLVSELLLGALTATSMEPGKMDNRTLDQLTAQETFAPGSVLIHT